MVDIQSAAAEIRRGKKEEEERWKPHGKKISWPALLHRAAIKTDEKPEVKQIRTTITN